MIQRLKNKFFKNLKITNWNKREDLTIKLRSIALLNIHDREQFKYLKTRHSWHLVDPSPWPLVAALGAFFLTSGGVLYMHKFTGGGQLCLTGFIIILY